MNRDKNFRSETLYRFVEIIFLPALGLIVAFIYHATENRTKAVSIVVAYVVIVALFCILDLLRRSRIKELERHEKEVEKKSTETDRRQREIDEQARLLVLAREGEMLSSASRKLVDGLWEITLQYSKLGERPLRWGADENSWGYKRKREILKHICEVLKEDRKNYESPSDYFKATLFRVASRDRLTLDCCYYPSGVFPKTDEIDREPHALATAFLCLDEQTMQVIPNVPEEIRKPKARWVELYDGQAHYYGSMVCVPITSGERGTPTFRVISILTIDTNRLNYFSDQKKDENFLAILLAPFRQQLSFLYLAAPDASVNIELKDGDNEKPK